MIIMIRVECIAKVNHLLNSVWKKIIGVLLGLQATKIKPFCSLSSGRQHYSSLTDDELAKVRLGEAAELFKSVIFRHRQPTNVRRKAAQRDEGEVWCSLSPLLQSQDCTEDVCQTFGHFWGETQPKFALSNNELTQYWLFLFSPEIKHSKWKRRSISKNKSSWSAKPPSFKQIQPEAKIKTQTVVFCFLLLNKLLKYLLLGYNYNLSCQSMTKNYLQFFKVSQMPLVSAGFSKAPLLGFLKRVDLPQVTHKF